MLSLAADIVPPSLHFLRFEEEIFQVRFSEIAIDLFLFQFTQGFGLYSLELSIVKVFLEHIGMKRWCKLLRQDIFLGDTQKPRVLPNLGDPLNIPQPHCRVLREKLTQ